MGIGFKVLADLLSHWSHPVIIAGADLFTGDTLMIMACYGGSIQISQMLRRSDCIYRQFNRSHCHRNARFPQRALAPQRCRR